MRQALAFGLVGTLLLVATGCGSSGGGGAPSYVEPGVQTATLEVDLTTFGVTVTQQPTNLLLTPQGNANLAGVANSLSLDLDIRNDYGRILFNVKAAVTAINDGGAAPTADGMFDGDPFYFWGHQGMDLGASRARTLVIDNVTISGTLTIDLTIHNHRAMFGTDGYYSDDMFVGDVAGTDIRTVLPEFDTMFGLVGYGSSSGTGGHSNAYTGVITSDSRYAYWGCRNQPAIIRLDTVSMTAVLTTDLTGNDNIKHDEDGTGSIGFVRGVCMSPDEQFLYAVLSTGGHMYEGVDNYFDTLGMTLELVKVRRSDMAIVGRAVVFQNVDEVYGSRPAITPDGRFVTFCSRTDDGVSGNPATVRARAFVVDAAAMTFVTHDLSGDTTMVDMVALSADAATIYYTTRDNSNNSLHQYVRATGAITEIPSSTPDIGAASNMDTQDMRWVGGRLYVNCAEDGFHCYDPGAGTFTNIFSKETKGPIQPALDGQSVFLMSDNNNLVHHLQIPSGTENPAPADGATSIAATELDDCHAFLVTHR